MRSRRQALALLPFGPSQRALHRAAKIRHHQSASIKPGKTLIVQRSPGKMFDMIEQRVACRGRAVGIFIGDREGDGAMQHGGVYYRGMAVLVDEPEAPRPALHQRRRFGRELVVGRRQQQIVEPAVGAGKQRFVVGRAGGGERGGDLAKRGRLRRAPPRRRARRQQAVDHPANFEHAQLLADVEVGDQHAAARQDADQSLAG